MMYDNSTGYFQVVQEPIIMLNYRDKVKLTQVNAEIWKGKYFADHLSSKCLISIIKWMRVA
jgi:hypothetical protein